jgi:thiol-disulfide isomerase/thioredoxin
MSLRLLPCLSALALAGLLGLPSPTSARAAEPTTGADAGAGTPAEARSDEARPGATADTPPKRLVDTPEIDATADAEDADPADPAEEAEADDVAAGGDAVPALAPIDARDRHLLATMADSLPAHGVAPVTVPPDDGTDEAWAGLARRLAFVFAPRRLRHGKRLRALLATRPLGPALQALVPTHRRYVALLHLLATQRDQLMAGQPRLPRTPYRVQVGATAPEVGLLRQRLLREGYGKTDVSGRLVDYFDANLKRALWAWQKDHDLPITVWLDDLTRARLNEPVASAADAVLLALARWREIDFRVDAPRQIIVHINAQRLSAERAGAEPLTMPVSVGRSDADNRTPMLSSRVLRVTANPSWRVPRRIVEDEMQPLVEGEPERLRERGYSVDIDSRGDWRVTQAPGPDNPLGRVKFSLYRTGGVYLHDTPNAKQFQSARRSVSHGCVRLQAANTLAAWVLEGDDLRAFEQAMNGPSTRSFEPSPPLPVHLVYQTLGVDPDGRVVRYPDIYKLDAEDGAGIDAPRVLAAPPRPPRQTPPAPGLERVPGDTAPPVSAAEPAAAAPPKPGPPAPQPPYGLRFAVEDTAGQTSSLTRHAGHLTAIMFASETCAPCHAMAPSIATLARELAARGETLDFIAIDAEHAIGDAPRTWAEPLDAPVYRVPEPVLRGASPLGQVEVLPTLWIVGRTGVPLYRYEGAGAEVLQALRDDLERYLAAEAGQRARSGTR